MSRAEKVKAVAIIAIMTIFISMNCDAQGEYVGINIGEHNSGFKKGYGQEVFAQRSSFLDIHVGKMFHDNWGIEGGTYIVPDRKRTASVIGASSSLPGLPLTPNYNHITKSEMQKMSFYIGVIHLYPVTQKLSFFSMFGLARTWMRNEYTPVVFNNIVLTLSQQATLTKTFKTRGNIIIAKVGARCNITDNFGIQAVFSWENTGRFKTKAQQSPHLLDSIKHKNTSKIGIGFYLKT